MTWKVLFLEEFATAFARLLLASDTTVDRKLRTRSVKRSAATAIAASVVRSSNV